MTKAEKLAMGEKAREEFRLFLVEQTGCIIQESEHGKAYPCGTCVIFLLGIMGLDSHDPAYSRREDDDIDRANEVWRAILQIRDAKL